MATTVVETGFLSGYLSISQPTLQQTIDAPTTELVNALLAAVQSKAREHQELEADKHQVDTELEAAVLNSEARTKELKEAAEKASKEANELREKLTNEENSRKALETELQQVKAATISSISEAEILRTRISSLEAASRDTLALVASKSAANDSLAQDLQKQHQKGLELSQQVSSLQQSLQEAQSALSSAKFREQNIKQELEQAKRNNEWLDTELKTKSADALKTRKEKGARISELSRQNEEISASLEASKRTETALRTRLEEIQAKAEESLSRVQQLQEQAATTEEGFRQELESSKRLAGLQKQQAETHRARLKEVEALLEKARDDVAEEAARRQQHAEAENQERDRLESRIVELESEVDRLEASVTATYPASMPGTPRQGMNGSVYGTPGGFTTPKSTRKSTITATQAIEELYKVKGLLATERRRNERLSTEMEEMMQGLEAKQPEIEEMQSEHERLQQEVVEMSKFVDATGKERDQARKEARKAIQDAKNSQAEAEILRQQLRDLSAQIKMLLCDLDAQQRGVDSLSGPERMHMESLARGEMAEEDMERLTDTDRFISERLVVFRGISDLQEKNAELLRIIRELGAKMESEEALAEKNQAAEDHAKVEQLSRQVEQANDEMKAMVARSESYIKERDMFRRMLQHRGQIPQTSDVESMFGQSVNGGGSVFNSIEAPNAKDNQNYAQLLRELQAHFDHYREEQSNDRFTLKSQADRLASDKATLQSDIAKINSQLTLAGERYEMLRANYAMLQKENSELQKRSQILSQSAAKQDLRTQSVAEDLIEAKGLVESMRNEIANLKAEKSLWTEIQGRLNQDNENLANERSRLNALIANQQSLQNERELTESETRRRLQTQVETLESELIATKRKLTDEVDDNKKAQLRKEYDAQQNQKRIDELASSLSAIREEMSAAKAERDLLQKRVEELTIELKSAEERFEVLQPKAGTVEEQSEDTISHEQELALEISEIKRDMELTKSELENAKSQIEQYKQISQSSEEDLSSFQETHAEYEKEMDKLVEEKDGKIRELQGRVNDLSNELSNTNTELNRVRSEQAEAVRRASEEKSVLESEISRLRDEDERHAKAAQFHQQDLRAQAEIATQAQRDYENELIKHAEVAQTLQELRASFNEMKSSSAELKAEAESAKAALSQSEASWNERKSQFEKELQELRVRKDDIGSQNTILLQQLEDVTAQVTALQHSRAAAAESGQSPVADELTAPADKTVEGLRELVTYLRRDKEIVDVQYELSIQDSKRLKQQLDYAQSQLDETRLKLDQERRAQADGSRNNLAHKDLMEKLNELNLFRESSITLRNEARQAQAQLEEKTKKVEELMQTIQPLKAKVRELENVKEMQDGEMKLLQEDRDRWQKRNQEILSKYDRIDPAEMEQLQEKIHSLTAERDELLASQQPLQEKIQTMEANWQASRTKLVEQAKERSRKLTQEKNERVAERTAERDAVIQQKEAVEHQLAATQQELENTIQSKQTLEEQLQSTQAELEAAQADAQAAHAMASQSAQAAETAQSSIVAVTPTDASIVAKQDTGVNEQLEAIRHELDVAVQEKLAVEQQLITIRQELDEARAERNVAFATAARQSEASKGQGADEGEVEESAPPQVNEEELNALRERAAEAENRLQQLEESLDATLKQRSEKMKAALNKKLQDSRKAAEDQFSAKMEEERLEAKKVAEEEYNAKLEQERQLYNHKLEQEKKIWLSENKTAAPAILDAQLQQVSVDTKPAEAAPMLPTTPSKPPPTPSSALNLTDDEARNLLATNPLLKSVFVANLKKKIEDREKRMKEEHEKEKEELLKKSDTIKVQAVNMETKRSELKLNMTANRERLAQSKIKVVEKFAIEEPQKPVVEVWEIVKAVKPEPAPAAASAVASAAKPAVTPTPSQPAVKEEGAPATSGLRTPSTTVPALVPAPAQAQGQVPAQNQQPRPHTPSMNAGNVPANSAPSAPQSNGLNIPAVRPPHVILKPHAPFPVKSSKTVTFSSEVSYRILPAPDYDLASVQSAYISKPSGIPAPRTGIPMPRGGGQRGGRGGAYQVPRGQSGIGRGARGGAQRGGMNMNPGVQHFSPGQQGNKRPHEGGDIGGQKRMRGGAGQQ